MGVEYINFIFLYGDEKDKENFKLNAFPEIISNYGNEKLYPDNAFIQSESKYYVFGNNITIDKWVLKIYVKYPKLKIILKETIETSEQINYLVIKNGKILHDISREHLDVSVIEKM